MGVFHDPSTGDGARPTRRRYLALVTSVSVASIAGCSSDGDDGTQDTVPTDTGPTQPTGERTETPGTGTPGSREVDPPNATYPPGGDQPLIGYEENLRTGTVAIEGEEAEVDIGGEEAGVEVDLFIDRFLYVLQGWSFATGTVLVPGVDVEEVPESAIVDEPVEKLMEEPERREQLLRGFWVTPEIARNQTDPRRVDVRPVPDPGLFEATPRIETWVLHSDRRSMVLDVTRGSVDLAPLNADYDGEVTLASGTYRIYEDAPGGGGTPVGNPIPEGDIQTAKREHGRLLAGGLELIADPEGAVDVPTTPPGGDLSPPDMTVTYDPPTTDDPVGYLPVHGERLGGSADGSAPHPIASLALDGPVAELSHGAIGQYEMVPRDGLRTVQPEDELPFVDVTVTDDGTLLVTITCEGETRTFDLGTKAELIELIRNEWLDLLQEAIDRWIGHLKAERREAIEKRERFEHTGGSLADEHLENARERIRELDEKIAEAKRARKGAKQLVRGLVARLRGEAAPEDIPDGFVFDDMPRELFVLFLMMIRNIVDPDFMDDIPDAWRTDDLDCGDRTETPQRGGPGGAGRPDGDR